MDTNGLINPVEKTFTHVSYDRANKLILDNPYKAAPSAVLKMERVTIDKDTEELISTDALPDVQDPYVPGKVYQMFNPLTGAPIPGATFTSEQFYAMAYSLTVQAVAK